MWLLHARCATSAGFRVCNESYHKTCQRGLDSHCSVSYSSRAATLLQVICPEVTETDTPGYLIPDT